MPIFARNVPLVSLIFLKDLYSLSHSIVFLCFFALIPEEGFLISPCYSLELSIQMGISFLFSFAFTFSSFSAICRASSDNDFCLFAFLFLGDGLDYCLLYNVTNLHPQFFRNSIRSNPLTLICHFHCIIIKDLIQVIPEWSSGFLYLLQFKSKFGNKVMI